MAVNAISSVSFRQYNVQKNKNLNAANHASNISFAAMPKQNTFISSKVNAFLNCFRPDVEPSKGSFLNKPLEKVCLNDYIESTLLKQDATRENLIKLFKEAINNKFFGVCINPSRVKLAKQYLQDTNIKIVTVVGFPLGANKSEVKAFEAKRAIKDGANEIDMVMNVGFMKDKNYKAVQKDIETVKKACKKTPLKVILETDLLTPEEIEKACGLCIKAKANFVKTSTGFVKNGVGAKVEDVSLMYETVSRYGLRVKAFGGIKDTKYAKTLIQAGAKRLGTSSGVEIVTNKNI
jgi:deoxyribose-phosphate aldolase